MIFGGVLYGYPMHMDLLINPHFGTASSCCPSITLGLPWMFGNKQKPRELAKWCCACVGHGPKDLGSHPRGLACSLQPASQSTLCTRAPRQPSQVEADRSNTDPWAEACLRRIVAGPVIPCLCAGGCDGGWLGGSMRSRRQRLQTSDSSASGLNC